MESKDQYPETREQEDGACAQYQEWISGYLDGELDKSRERLLEKHILVCPECRRDYEVLKRLVVGTDILFSRQEPPEEAWDTFLDGVYNRLERKTGWYLLIIGAVLLTLFGAHQFITQHWSSALVKILLATPAVGLAILFISVWRQRWQAAKTDRYSKEIYR